MLDMVCLFINILMNFYIKATRRLEERGDVLGYQTIIAIP